MTDYPLAGVKVLDLTQYVAGPYCTQIFADLGATVVKIERKPHGDIYRRQGPVFAAGESASFLTLNRGKRSLPLDLGSAEDRARAEALLAEADVLVENMKPGTLAKFGLGYDQIREIHPHLVYCSISGFGQDGPSARRGGYDLTIQALSGLMDLTGPADGEPAKIPVAALDFGSAMYAAIGVLSALRARDRTGVGTWVRASILETALAWLSMHVVTYLIGGRAPRREGTRSPFFAPYEAYRTADGYVVLVGTGGTRAWEDLCAALGRTELVDDPRFRDNHERVRNADALKAEVEAATVRRPTAEWERIMEAAGVPYAPVQTLPDVLRDRQVRSLGIVQELEHPTAGSIPIVRLPVTFSTLRATADAPPPRLGEHGDRGFAP